MSVKALFIGGHLDGKWRPTHVENPNERWMITAKPVSMVEMLADASYEGPEQVRYRIIKFPVDVYTLTIAVEESLYFGRNGEFMEAIVKAICQRDVATELLN